MLDPTSHNEIEWDILGWVIVVHFWFSNMETLAELFSNYIDLAAGQLSSFLILAIMTRIGRSWN